MYCNILNIIKELKVEKDLFVGNFGIEKEHIRVDKLGRMVLTPHPEIFGDKLENPYITTDFSESQIELIIPIFNTIEDCYDFLDNLHDEIADKLDDEYLWPQSMPPISPGEDLIPIAKFNNSEAGRKAEMYRESLAQKYGKKMQLISGLHYNFSFKDEFLEKIYNETEKKVSLKDFRDNIYLKICRNFFKYNWLLTYLTGATPAVHNSYMEECVLSLDTLDIESSYYENAISLRNYKYGYRNSKDFIIPYNNVKDYIKKIDSLTQDGEIWGPMEYYSTIRIKPENKGDYKNSLLENGIKYIEIRAVDLNPLFKNGVNVNTLYIVHLFILFCFLNDEEEFTEEMQKISLVNNDIISSEGRKKDVEIYKDINKKVLFKDYAEEVLNKIESILEYLNIKDTKLNTALDQAVEMINNPEKTPSARVLNGIKEKTYIGFHMEKIL